MLSNDAKELIDYIKTLFFDVKLMNNIPEKFMEDQDFLELDAVLKGVRNSVGKLGEGKLVPKIMGEGYILSSLENLHIALKELTEKTKAIGVINGFQEVNFLDKFSEAFNSITKQIETAIKKLEEAQEHFELVFQTMPDAAMITTLEEGKLIAYNEAFKKMILNRGGDFSDENMSMPDLYFELDKSERFIEELNEKGFCENMEICINNFNDKELFGIVSSRIINVEGKPNILSVIRDITLLKQFEEKYQLLADNTTDVVWIMDLNGKFTYVSPSVKKLRGFTAEEAMRQSLDDWLSPDSAISIHKELANIIKGVKNNRPFKIYKGKFEHLCKDGHTLLADTTISAIYDEEGNFTGIQGVARDISERKRLKEEIERLSITDNLTQLYNRIKIDEILVKELERSERTKTPFSIILLDIDFFKKVNDTYGHQIGDTVLVELAKILTENIRSTDIVGRWNGEEFLIILTDTDKKGTIILAEKLRKLVSNYDFTEVGKLTASFGISEYKKDLLPASIISRADSALLEAKEQGRNQINFL